MVSWSTAKFLPQNFLQSFIGKTWFASIREQDTHECLHLIVITGPEQLVRPVSKWLTTFKMLCHNQKY